MSRRSLIEYLPDTAGTVVPWLTVSVVAIGWSGGPIGT